MKHKFVTIFDPKTPINFASQFKLSMIIAVILPIVTLIGLFIFGVNLGIDFSGGSELHVKFSKPVSSAEIRQVLNQSGFEKNQIQQFGPIQNNEMLIRVERAAALKHEEVDSLKPMLQKDIGLKQESIQTIFDEKTGNQLVLIIDEPFIQADQDPNLIKDSLIKQKNDIKTIIEKKAGLELRATRATLTEEASTNNAVVADEPKSGKVKYTIHFAGVSNKIQKELENKFGSIEIRKVDFVDSQVSKQLKTDGILAVVYSILAIVIYIMLRFDMYFAPGTVFALINDIMIAMLLFLIFRLEFDAPSIAALLTIVGYSINNTVVVFDRIRETLPSNPKKPLSVEETIPYVNKAINDTLSRTINTTLTTLFSSLAIYIFTNGMIKTFALVLSVGITFGALTSMLVAPAAYILAKKYFHHHDTNANTTSTGYTREDKHKGVV